MQKITPFLWFNGNAEEAMNFYTSVFKDAKVGKIHRYGAGGPAPEGTVLTATFYLHGQEFMVLNGGPQFSFTPAVSFFVKCETQEEVDRLWEQLSEGGREDRCGWLQDKYGLSWQIVPNGLEQVLWSKDAVRSQSAMNAMMQMSKLDMNALQYAYDHPGAATEKTV